MFSLSETLPVILYLARLYTASPEIVPCLQVETVWEYGELVVAGGQKDALKSE